MNSNLTELIFILDRSGSMHGLEADTVGGFNSLLEKQKKEIIANAREEARIMLREAKDTAAEVQKELKELAKLDSLGERTKRFDKSRKKLKEKDYTKESFKGFKAALKNAEKVLKDKKATQADIDTALAELNDAVNALEAKAPVKHKK